jgi:hypothetical protein
MTNATGTGLFMAEQDDRTRPDTGPEREDIRGVTDVGDGFDDDDEDDDLEEDEAEDEGTF